MAFCIYCVVVVVFVVGIWCMDIFRIGYVHNFCIFFFSLSSFLWILFTKSSSSSFSCSIVSCFSIYISNIKADSHEKLKYTKKKSKRRNSNYKTSYIRYSAKAKIIIKKSRTTNHFYLFNKTLEANEKKISHCTANVCRRTQPIIYVYVVNGKRNNNSELLYSMYNLYVTFIFAIGLHSL